MTTNQPLSIFISSKMTELAQERQIVKSALAGHHMYGWLFEQDAGARPEPIRSTYLKEVEACDIYIGIFWHGYGPYTIEEYERARVLHKPCLIYEKESDPNRRDPPLRTFLESIQRVDAPEGLTVCRFRTSEELAAQVRNDVMRLLVTNFRRSSQQPVWNVPSYNPNFTGYDDLLAHIHQALTTSGQHNPAHSRGVAPTRIVAISGLGGMGKTELAIEYAYRHRQDYQHVLWASADTHTTLFTSFVKFAHLLNLPEKDDKRQNVAVEAVKAWFVSRSDWLLILDNIDNLALVDEFLPSTPGGHILLTTRSQATGEVAHHKFVLEKMPPDMGALLLLRRSGLLKKDLSLEQASRADVQLAMDISNMLGGLPLALDQAGAYIEETLCSLQDYYHLYQKQRAALLKRRGGLGKGYPESVATAWTISFQKIKNPAAIDLLHLCAFLMPDEIPEELITQGAPHLGTTLQRVVANQKKRDKTSVGTEWDETVAALLKYSLIKRDGAKRMLSIHQLVQAVVRDALPPHERKVWAKRLLHTLDALFSPPRSDASNPNAEIASWPLFERLVAHVLLCADWAEQESIEPERMSQLLTKAGSYLQNRGRFTVVEPYYKRAYELQANLKGFAAQTRIALFTSSSLINLSTLYIAQGEYKKAEAALQQVQRNYERQRMDSGLFMAQLWNALGALYLLQGRYTEAEMELCFAKVEYETEIKSSRKPLGALKLKVEYAVALSNLACVYRERGCYQKAEPLYRQSWSIRQNLRGPQDLFAAKVLYDLATLYRAQGKYEEAENLYQRVLRLLETLLEQSHPDMATVQNALATLYRSQGKYIEAEELYTRALRLRLKLFGESHPDTATSQNDLATLYCLQQRYEQAEPLYRQALAIRERLLDVHHLDIAESLYSLATLYCLQGKYVQAEPLYLRALSICDKQDLCQEHPLPQKIDRNYRRLLRAMGRDEGAR